MKRYNIFVEWDDNKIKSKVEEVINGEWVKYEDAQKEIEKGKKEIKRLEDIISEYEEYV